MISSYKLFHINVPYKVYSNNSGTKHLRNPYFTCINL